MNLNISNTSDDESSLQRWNNADTDTECVDLDVSSQDKKDVDIENNAVAPELSPVESDAENSIVKNMSDQEKDLNFQLSCTKLCSFHSGVPWTQPTCNAEAEELSVPVATYFSRDGNRRRSSQNRNMEQVLPSTSASDQSLNQCFSVSPSLPQCSAWLCQKCARKYDIPESSHDSYWESLQIHLLSAIDRNDVIAVRTLLHIQKLHPDFEMELKNPICRATSQGDIDIMTLLLDAGANPNTPNSMDLLWQRRPVHIAASKGHFSALQLLIQKGSNINQHDCDQRTPLHWVAMYGQSHMIRWMLSAGAAVNVAQRDGLTPLHTATCLGHLEVCKLLIEGGAEMTRRDRDGWTPLHTAVCYGYIDIVRLFLEKGTCPLVKICATGDTTLHIACRKGNEDIVDLLLEKGVPVESKNNYGFTPLHTAVYYNRVKITYKLIKVGADVNTKQSTGQSPIYLAKVRCETDTLRMLLQANCRVQDSSVSVPLWNHAPDIAILLEHKSHHPQLLLEMCAVVIRQALAPSLQTNVQALPIPSSMKQMLAIDSLDPCFT